MRLLTHLVAPGRAYSYLSSKRKLCEWDICSPTIGLTLEAVYGDEGRGFGRNDPGVEVGQLVRLQVAPEDLKKRVLRARNSRNLSGTHF